MTHRISGRLNPHITPSTADILENKPSSGDTGAGSSLTRSVSAHLAPLVSRNQRKDVKQQRQNQKLGEAAVRNDITALRHYLQDKGANATSALEKASTPEAVSILLEHGADASDALFIHEKNTAIRKTILDHGKSDKRYSEGLFSGPQTSPSTSMEDLNKAFTALGIEGDATRKPMGLLQIQKLLAARIDYTKAISLRAPDSTPPFAGSSEPAESAAATAIKNDEFLGFKGKGLAARPGASIKQRIEADDQFATLGNMTNSLLTRAAMEVVRAFINTQPVEIHQDLCKAMIDDIKKEITNLPAPDPFGMTSTDPTAAGKTIRAAMEILVEKDNNVEDENDFSYSDLMMNLENFRRDRSIDFNRNWGEEDV